ncbi:MAG: hypothetical protein H7172_10465 [Ferruginibacter sp.]|nr:hypothetical protein [Rhodoferax sp.]
MAYDVTQLLAMGQTELDDLFRVSPPGDFPNGSAVGTAIIAPGTQYTESIAHLINLFGWRGLFLFARHPRPAVFSNSMNSNTSRPVPRANT